jgi:hypothetical protein
MAASWAEVLDLYGRALVDLDRGLDAGEHATTGFTFELPPDLGPLPPELAATASEVAEMSERIESRVREAMAATAREQAAVTRARTRPVRERPPAKFVDVDG